MNKKMITVAMTGASGIMGTESLRQILELECVDRVKVLLVRKNRERKYAKKIKKLYGDRVDVAFGDVADIDDCRKLVADSDYVLHLAAVIPPKADHYPKETEACNRFGTMNIVDAIKELGERQPKLVHISTVAIYGHRNYKHPWGRVGDPLLPSAYDEYAETKIKGERYVLDSDLKCWVVLRQTGTLYGDLLMANISDGLMFHTCYNVPIEWVTARDSGLAMKHLIERDVQGELKDFWFKCYNIGGGPSTRIIGFEIFDRGFKMIGGSTEKFMNPTWNATRNFHCMWFEDSHVLNEYLDFQRQSFEEFWQETERTHKYFAVAKALPAKFISAVTLMPLLDTKNSPRYWIKHGMEGRVMAAFGSVAKAERLPRKWKHFRLISRGQNPDDELAKLNYSLMLDESKIAENGFRLNHGYDESKPDSELDIEDMQSAAAFRGGKCISTSMTKGDLYTKLEWECHDGHRFFASPYTIIKAGHWCPVCSVPEPWDYDRLAKDNPFFAQVWYDSHKKNENAVYWFDEKHVPQYRIFDEKD